MILEARPRVRTAAALLAAALAVSGCGGAKKADGPPPLAVEAGTVTRQDLATYANLDGQIAPVQESLLSTPQSGNVISVNVHEGDHVRQGQLLAKLDDSTLRATLAANEADLAQNRAKLQSSQAQAPISAVGYNSNLQTAQNALATAQAALANAQLVYKSNQDLYPKGYVSQTALEQSRSQFVSAQQQVNTAKAELVRAQQNMQSTRVDQAAVDAAKAAVQNSSANVQLLQAQIAQTNIVAPFDGVVTQRLLDPGAFASANSPVVRVSQLDPVYVNFNVPDDLLSYVKAGTPVTFTTPSLPSRRFTATVASVNATPTQGTLSYRAQIREPNPDNALRGGMLVTTRVRKDFRAQTTVVPRTAVEQGEAGTFIYAIKDGKAQKIPVKVGLQTDVQAEVTGPGVTPGLQIITTRPDALQDGSPVAIAGAPPAGGAASASPAAKKAQ
jgi:multidrug efflux pump subunit AcrA (membrane-fusion protein)